jgi:hypothetical protein
MSTTRMDETGRIWQFFLPSSGTITITDMNTSALIENAAHNRWSTERTWKWHASLDWPVGCNFLPSSAVNQLEMWQADTFNPEEIDRELSWLAAFGMNTARVFLHDLLWKQDSKGFLSRIDQFLDIADRHGMRIMFVFFDSCWNAEPVIGPQRAPTPGVHNSYWVQSPGVAIVSDAAAFAKLEDYVAGVVNHLCDDKRVLIWDVWNEPNNANSGNFPAEGPAAGWMNEIIPPLLSQAFGWIRSVNPSQPLTSGVWNGNYSTDDTLTALQELQLFSSDVISFHSYGKIESVQSAVEVLKRFKRPLVCTEYLARQMGSTFEAILPYFKEEKVAAYNWGAVAGKSQTNYPWDSWQKPYTQEPSPWHHDILRVDGSPYDPQEIEVIKSLRLGSARRADNR